MRAYWSYIKCKTMKRTLNRLERVRTKSKPQELQERLTSLAHRVGAGGKLPTVAQLCQELQVSPTTLNSAFHALENEGVVERRHGVGIFATQNVRQKVTRDLVLLSHPLYFRGASHSPFWDLIVEEAQKRAQAKNERLSCHFVLPEEMRDTPESFIHSGLLADIRSGRVQGVLGVGLDEFSARWLVDAGVPFVSYANYATVMVSSSPNELTQIAMSLLAQRGCQKVGLWSPVGVWKPGMERDLGLMNSIQARDETIAAIASVELPYLPALNRNLRLEWLEQGFNIEEAPSNQEQGFNVAMEIFSGSDAGQWPDGLYIIDDLTTHGVLVALRKLGLTIGQDVTIVTHANAGSPMLFGENDIIRLLVDPSTIAEKMFEALEKWMDGEVPQTEIIIDVAPQVQEMKTEPS